MSEEDGKRLQETELLVESAGPEGRVLFVLINVMTTAQTAVAVLSFMCRR